MTETRAFNRLSVGLSPDHVRELMNPTVRRDYQLFFRPLMAINRAHVVMLAEEEILAGADAATILRGLDHVETAVRPETLREGLDLYFNVERALLDRVGS